jgi:DNA/RNA-binding domain of Phe-tRNA-synthetase-like protein
MEFHTSPEIARVVRPGVLRLDGATIVDRDSRLDVPLASAEAAVRSNPPSEVTAVRTMYKRIGLDPTRNRPSSEALLRRVRKGDTLPRINSMVDICNWCSLEFQLPYGLYDADHIEGPVELRTGRPGESYAGIRKDVVHVGDRIALADARGPFGNPTSDSQRTMVSTATSRLLVVVFAPMEVPSSRLADVLDTTSARMHQFTGCSETDRLVG